MWERIALGILLAAAAYFVVRYFNKEGEGFSNWSSVTEVPGPSPLKREPIPRGDSIVSSGGPSTPNVAAPPTMPAVRMPPAEANDPYDLTQESANAPETLRHPERLFGPGVEPSDNTIAVESGIASDTPAISPQAFQTFNPEHITTGGSFFGTVSAMENENPNYSAF